MLECLRGENEIVLCGIDMKAQDAYDFLLGNGIEVYCFAVNELTLGCMHRLFGKKIIDFNEAVSICQNPIFIECSSKNSAWGLGDVDYYDYIGYKRNERYILLRDYLELPGNNLLNVLKKTELVMAGERNLCERLHEYFVQKNILVKGYLRTLPEDLHPRNMPEVSVGDINENMLCIIVSPVYHSYTKSGKIKEAKRQRVAFVRENEIDNFTDYFCDMVSFINIESDNAVKYREECLKPKRIVLGSILSGNGNEFFRSLLDFHPQILSINYCDFNNQLFWICVHLSMERAENILSLFWKLIEGDSWDIGDKWDVFDRSAFEKKIMQAV